MSRGGRVVLASRATRRAIRTNRPRPLAAIRRDRHGFPHILGRSDEAVIFAHAVAQFEDAPLSVLLALARASGCLTAMLGLASPVGRVPHDPHVEADRQALLFGHLAHGRRLLASMPPRLRRWTIAFAAGLRAARRREGDSLLARLRGDPPGLDVRSAAALASMPIRAEQITALDHFIAARTEIERLLRPPSAPDSSNAVAVAASASTGGHPLLLVDPHIPFDALPELRLLITRLRGRTIDMAGLTRPASLLPALGWSGGAALAVTSNWPATSWRVRCERRGDRVLLFGRWRRLVRRTAAIGCLGGRVVSRPIHHVGRDRWPVLRLTRRHAWVALMATRSGGALTEQSVRLAHWRPPSPVLSRLLRVPGHPGLNYLVARADGAVEYRWNARLPEEVDDPLSPFGARLEIDGARLRRPPSGCWPVDRLPGGSGGVLVNNNASFDRLHGEPDGLFDRYPEAVRGGPESLTSFRHARAIEWLRARGNRPVGMATLETLALDSGHPRGQAFVDLVRRAPGRRSAALDRALRSLARWPVTADASSRACSLVELALLEARARLDPTSLASLDYPDLARRLPPATRRVLALALARAWPVWVAAGRPRWGDLHGLFVWRGGRRRWIGLGGTGHTLRAAEVLVPPARLPRPGGDLPSFVVGHGQACALVVRLSSPPRIRFLKVLANREGSRSDRLRQAWVQGRFQDLEMDEQRIERITPTTLIVRRNGSLVPVCCGRSAPRVARGGPARDHARQSASGSIVGAEARPRIRPASRSRSSPLPRK